MLFNAIDFVIVRFNLYWALACLRKVILSNVLRLKPLLCFQSKRLQLLSWFPFSLGQAIFVRSLLVAKSVRTHFTVPFTQPAMCTKLFLCQRHTSNIQNSTNHDSPKGLRQPAQLQRLQVMGRRIEMVGNKYANRDFFSFVILKAPPNFKLHLHTKHALTQVRDK